MVNIITLVFSLILTAASATESCNQVFSGFPAGWGIKPEFAKTIWNEVEGGPDNIRMGLAMVHFFENVSPSFYEALAYYQSWPLHVNLQQMDPNLLKSFGEMSTIDLQAHLDSAVQLHSIAKLAGPEVQSLIDLEVEKAGSYFYHGLLTVLTCLPRTSLKGIRPSTEAMLAHIEQMLTKWRPQAVTLIELLRHSRVLRVSLAESMIVNNQLYGISSANFDQALLELDRALSDFPKFQQTFQHLNSLNPADPEVRKQLQALGHYARVIHAFLAPPNKKAADQMQNWLNYQIIKIAYELSTEARNEDGTVARNMILQIHDFVVADTLEGTEYQAFMAALVASTYFDFRATRPGQMKLLVKKEVQDQFRHLVRQSETYLADKKASLQPTATPALTELDQKPLANFEKFFAHIDQQRKSQPIIREPRVLDELSAFVAGDLKISALIPDHPYRVMFHHTNAFIQGPQTVLFSPELIRQLSLAKDERGLRARDWLEAIQQGLAPLFERGIKRVPNEGSWQVVLIGTSAYAIHGKRDEKGRWYFDSFRPKVSSID